MDYSKFINEVRRDQFRNSYLFIGKEDFLAETGVKELSERLLTPDEKDFNLSVFYGKDADKLSIALNTPPLFASRRVIIVKQAGDLSGVALDAVLSFLSKPSSDVCLILWAGDIDKRKTSGKKIEALTQSVICNKLKSSELQAWVAEYAGKFGKKLDNEATNRLCAVNWPSLRELAGEIDRLTLMIGEKAVVTIGDIEEMGGGSVGLDRWGLANAIAEGNMAGSMAAIQNLLDWGVKPNQIVGDVYRLLWQLWYIRWHADKRKLSEAKAAMDLKDYIFNKLQRQADKFSIRVLEDAILRVLDAELSIKRGERHDSLESINLVTDVLATLNPVKTRRGAA